MGEAGGDGYRWRRRKPRSRGGAGGQGAEDAPAAGDPRPRRPPRIRGHACRRGAKDLPAAVAADAAPCVCVATYRRRGTLMEIGCERFQKEHAASRIQEIWSKRCD